MGLFTTLLVLCALNVILMPNTIYARPPSLLSRQRRVSDQILAERETDIGLGEVKGIIKVVPVGFGAFDLQRIGRRRRSAINNKLETLQRIMQIINNNPELLDKDNILSSPVKLMESRQTSSEEYPFI
ncbi:uncharacterized protein LOC122721053 isoform X1 [Apis laboriosa]|uniref:uncharacterized protein LOC122721053 isoform X1 n=1 Tax=Apis laboriosa TaxID=183418 RepID=UPI001CC6B0A9|nr:uncharacterized protein LOC122721053 isoform X1 [Apis laboriosa]